MSVTTAGSWQHVNNAKSDLNRANNNMANLSKQWMSQYNDFVQNAFNAQANADAFNANEAQKQRDWSEAMSGTAHQREVADLRNAGLNPVISAYGSGASVGSGAAASSSNNLTGVFGQMASQALSAITSLAETLSNNATSYSQTMTNLYSQGRQQNLDYKLTRRGQDMSYASSIYNANTAASASRYSSELGYAASIYNSNVNRYCSELTNKTNLTMNQATNQMNKYIAELNSFTQQQCAVIAGEYGISRQEVANIASQYSSELAYLGTYYSANRHYDTAKMQQLEQRVTQMKGIDAQNAGNLISSIIGLAGSFVRR